MLSKKYSWIRTGIFFPTFLLFLISSQMIISCWELFIKPQTNIESFKCQYRAPACLRAIIPGGEKRELNNTNVIHPHSCGSGDIVPFIIDIWLYISVYSKILVLLRPYNNPINRCQFFLVGELWSWGAHNRASNRARAKPSESLSAHFYPSPSLPSPVLLIKHPLLFHHFTVILCVSSGFSVRLSGAMC